MFSSPRGESPTGLKIFWKHKYRPALVLKIFKKYYFRSVLMLKIFRKCYFRPVFVLKFFRKYYFTPAPVLKILKKHYLHFSFDKKSYKEGNFLYSVKKDAKFLKSR